MIRIPHSKIAVDPMPDPDVSPGGIIIPDEAKDKCDQGIVRYIGEDVHDIRVGDHVLFSAYSGTVVKLEGEGILIILHAEFVTCIIQSADTDIPGLYFRDTDGTYWNATREMATRFIADAVAQEDYLSARTKNTKPKREEIKRG